jgi:type IV pilus assembly protein PilM
MKTSLFYKPKTVFGIDIGHGAVKVVQLDRNTKGNISVGGYGYAAFDPSAIDKQGLIVDVESVARAGHQLIEEHMIGTIYSDRVTATIPSARTFTRVLKLPAMRDNELEGAVHAEAEQYIPVPLDQLYLDYEITKKSTKDDAEVEVLMVASPAGIVDSYMQVFSALGVEVAAIEPSLSAVTRSVNQSKLVKDVALVIDFGSRSSDMSIFEGTTIKVTGTTKQGGDDLTEQLVKKLGITKRQAFHGKARYGIKQTSKQGREIYTHARPILDGLVTEIKKLQRYYKRHNEKNNIEKIILLGGGANMPGLDEFLSKQTGMDVTLFDPWREIDMGSLQAPNALETTLYTTSVGSALLGAGVKI